MPETKPDTLPDDGKRTTVRLAFFYVAVFGLIGIHLPFWPVWLASRGLGPAEIGAVFGIATRAQDMQAGTFDGVKMAAAGDEAHVFAGLGQPAAKIAADPAGAENNNIHGLTFALSWFFLHPGPGLRTKI